MDELLKKTTGFHTDGFAAELDRDGCMDRVALAHGAEIDVDERTVEGVALNVLHDRELGLFVRSGDLNIDEEVVAGLLAGEVEE